MSFNPQEMFANLAEKEKIKGHHSPEGRAMRTLGRTANGWSTQSLSGRDVIALCDQAVEDWLKARLGLSSWSQPRLAVLLADAVKMDLITRSDAVRLQRLRNLGVRLDRDRQIPPRTIIAALGLCIRLIDKRW